MSDVHPILRKVLALAILAALLSVAWLSLLQPMYNQYWAYEDSIVRSAGLLERYQRIGAGKEQVAELLEEAKAGVDLSHGALASEGVELAGAEMQERLKRVVEGNGGQLNSSQVLAVDDKSAVRRLGIRVVMTGDIETLQRTLYDFETSEPYFFVDNLNIQASRLSLREVRGRRGRSNANPAKMQVRFDAYAYLRAAE